MQPSLSELLQQCSGLEAKLDAIRLFKKRETAKIEKADLEGSLRLPEVFKHLSAVAESILGATLNLAKTETIHFYKKAAEIKPAPCPFIAIGMGKLGGSEIHYTSDLDLIFLYDDTSLKTDQNREDPDYFPSASEFFSKLVQKLIFYLTVYTAEGYAYKIDTQLRASGNQGTLVSSFEAFKAYHQDSSFWEKQALLKARPVAGDQILAKTFTQTLPQLIFETKKEPDLHLKIRQMKEKIERETTAETDSRFYYKKGPGGLVDIEFLVQFIALKNGGKNREILEQNTLYAIEKINKAGFFDAETAECLKTAYLFYRLLELRIETSLGLKAGYVDFSNPALEKLAAAMKRKSLSALREEFLEIKKNVRSIYQAMLG